MPRDDSAALRQIRQWAIERRVRSTLKALGELASLDLGLDVDDACDILAGVTQVDLATRIQSNVTGEWMYVFKPRVEAYVLSLKVILRDDCLVVSFHEDEDSDSEDDS